MNKAVSLPALALLLLLGALAARARPQDATTNAILRDDMTQEDGESFVAGLILAVARDYDEGIADATEFIRTVPAASVNGTTFGPTTHPINQAGPISFSAKSSSEAA